jgi:hypothetical protein
METAGPLESPWDSPNVGERQIGVPSIAGDF